MKVLFATSEAFPFIKTGGLADVSGQLPLALQGAGVEVTLVLPAYQALSLQRETRVVDHVLTHEGYALVRETEIATGGPRLWLIDHPLFSRRPGNPYVDATGHDWADNGWRFGLFNQVVTELAAGHGNPSARFDLVHCNDWQAGLIPALLSQREQGPPTIFTIHNLAYQGHFPRYLFDQLGLPEALWSPSGVEFYGLLSFIKAGIAFARKVTTVSPTYAREIQTPAYAYGLEGLLQHRSADLVGILNGIDTHTWNPKSDPLIAQRYDAESLEDKAANKRALQERLGLAPDPDAFLLGHVGRMVEQKGIDLILAALPALADLPVQVAIVGAGEGRFEHAWRAAAEHWPGRVAVFVGYDEGMAHLVEAGADAFLMPSRFEPCGLNQMYSQAYGTPPIVSRTGGLADSVVETRPETLADGSASGFFLPHLDAAGLLDAIERALALYRQPEDWRRLMRNAMSKDFSWGRSATAYLELYAAVTGAV